MRNMWNMWNTWSRWTIRTAWIAVRLRTVVLVGAGLGTLGCSDLSGLAGKQALPSGIPDPNTLKTR